MGVVASHDRFLVCDLSIPVLMQKYYIVVPWPKEESRLLATIRPFQPEVLKKKKIPFLIVHREICLIIDDCAIDF